MKVATWRSVIPFLTRFEATATVTGAAREILLLHQFLVGLPVSISKQLRAAGDIMRVELLWNDACLELTYCLFCSSTTRPM